MLLRPEYLSQKLSRPLVTKDGGTLSTVLDARAYMLALLSAALTLRHAVPTIHQYRPFAAAGGLLDA